MNTPETRERLARVETNVETILTNHLPHIQARLDTMDNKFWAIILLLISTLVAVLATYLK